MIINVLVCDMLGNSRIEEREVPEDWLGTEEASDGQASSPTEA